MTDNKNKKRNGSAILRGVNRLAFWIERKIKNGFVGKILGSYSEENQALSKSFTASILGKRSKCGELLRKTRFVIAEQFEESSLLLLWRKFVGFLIGCRLRFYGTFFVTFGVYVGLIYFFKRFFSTLGEANISYVIISAILTVSAVPLLFSGQTLASKLKESRSGHFISVDILGIPEEKMSVPKSRYSDIYNIAIFAGIAFGTFSYFLNPIYILGGLGAFVASVLILTCPEIGVVAAVGFLPFFSQNGSRLVLSTIIAFYCFGYIIKLIRGKRVLSFEIIDIFILFFAIILAISGSLSAGDNAGTKAVELIVLLVGAFLAGNLMRTKLWQKRCVFSVILSSTLASMISVFKYVVNVAGFSRLSESLSKMVFFDGRNIFAAYLTIALLLIFAAIFHSKITKLTVVLYISVIIIATELILLNTLSAWIGITVSLILFFFIKTKKTFSVIAFTGVVTPCVFAYTYVFLPERFKNLLDLTSEGIYPLLKIWQGSMQLIAASAFSGVGLGGFEVFYPIYSAAGFEWSEVSGALWLRILSELGVVGLLVFAAIVFLFVQNCFEYMSTSNAKENMFIVASFTAVIGLLVMSLFCDFFSDTTFFYAFFCFMTVACAALRSERAETEKNIDITFNSEVSASVSL